MFEHIHDTTIPLLLGSLGIVLPVTSRAFLPAFLTSVYLLTIGWYGQGTQLDAVVELASRERWWIATVPACVVLGALTMADLVASKQRDVDAMLRLFDPLVKPVMAGVTAYGLTQGLGSGHGAAPHPAVVVAGPVVSAGLTFVFVFFRAELFEWIDDLELDGLSRAVAWLEDAWVVVAMVLLFVMPLVTLLLSAVVLALLSVLSRWLEGRARAQQRPCPSCGAPVYRQGLHCAGCGSSNASTCDVGWFGLPTERPAGERELHQTKLLRNGKCPRCAATLARRVGTQQCRDCGTGIFEDEESIEAYAATTTGTVELSVLAVVFGLGLIPVLGAIPAIVFYRSKLVAPYRRYLPAWQSLGLRTLARVLSFLLLLVQWVPVVGWASLPAMAWVNHRLHRAAFVRTARVGARQRRTLERPAGAPLAALGRVARRLRPVALPAFGVLAVAVAVGMFFGRDAAADAAVSCPGERDYAVGQWAEAFTPVASVHPLLSERLEADGTYWLEGSAGRYELDRGRVLFDVAGVQRRYAVWAWDEGLAYRSLGPEPRVSIYARKSPPPEAPRTCPARGAGLIGHWRADSGAEMRVGEDGSFEHGEWSGTWSARGARLEVTTPRGAGWVALNEADEALLWMADEVAVFVRAARE